MLGQALTGRFGDPRAGGRGDPGPHRLPRGGDRRVSARIEEVIAPFTAERDLLSTIPGVDQPPPRADRRDRGRHDPLRHLRALASWAGMCPGHHESAGKRPLGGPPQGLASGSAALLAEAARPRPVTQRHLPRRPAPPAQRAHRLRRGHEAVGHSSWSPAGTSSPTACPTTSSAPTGSQRASPKPTPAAWPARSKPSATASPSRPRPPPDPNPARGPTSGHRPEPSPHTKTGVDHQELSGEKLKNVHVCGSRRTPRNAQSGTGGIPAPVDDVTRTARSQAVPRSSLRAGW